MYSLKSSASFDSAHFLSGYDGKCANIHGHRWVIEAVLKSSKLHESGVQRGMLTDFGDLKHELRSIAESFDHKLIYEKGSLKEKTLQAFSEENFSLVEVNFRPTAENFAKYFFDRLKELGLPVKSIAVYETPENCGIYEED